ncbi:MAG: GC-type dockerin domain-anchored protein [Planctomycetota bacterium]
MDHDQKNKTIRFARCAVAAIVASTAGFASAADIEQPTVPDFDALRKSSTWDLMLFGDAAVAANAIVSTVDRGLATANTGWIAPVPMGTDWESAANLDAALTLMEELAVNMDQDRFGPAESADLIEWFFDGQDPDKISTSYRDFGLYPSAAPTEQIREAFVAGDTINLAVWVPDRIDMGEFFGEVAHGGEVFQITLQGVSGQNVSPAQFTIADPIWDDDNAYNQQSAFRFPTTRVGDQPLDVVFDPSDPYDDTYGVQTINLPRLYDATVEAYILGYTFVKRTNIFSPSVVGDALEIVPSGGANPNDKFTIPAPSGETIVDLAVASNGRDVFVLTRNDSGETFGYCVDWDPPMRWSQPGGSSAGDSGHAEWIELSTVFQGTTGPTHTVENEKGLLVDFAIIGARLAAIVDFNGQSKLMVTDGAVVPEDPSSHVLKPVADLPRGSVGLAKISGKKKPKEILVVGSAVAEIPVFDELTLEPKTSEVALLLPAVQAAREAARRTSNITLKRGLVYHTNNSDGTGTITYTGLEDASSEHILLFQDTRPEFFGTDMHFFDNDRFGIVNNGVVTEFDIIEVPVPGATADEHEIEYDVSAGAFHQTVPGSKFDRTPSEQLLILDFVLVPAPGALPELPGFIDPCEADVTTSGATLEGQAGFGIPDGTVDLDDLGYYLNAWVGGEPLADTTTTGATLEGQAGFGIADGTIDLDDLGYFLNAWLEGCP